MATGSVILLALAGICLLYTLWLFLVGLIIVAQGHSVRISFWPLVATAVFGVWFYFSLS
jgi:hypothetical protein